MQIEIDIDLLREFKSPEKNIEECDIEAVLTEISRCRKPLVVFGQGVRSSDSINELKREVKSLRQDVSKGKGAVAVLVFIGTLVASIVGFLNFK